MSWKHCPHCGKSIRGRNGQLKRKEGYSSIRDRSDMRPVIPWRETPSWRKRWKQEFGK